MRAFLAGLLLSVAASADTLVALNEQGIAHLRAGRAQAAVDAFEAALAKSPGSTVLKRNTAAALAAFAESKRKQDLPGQAIDALDRAIELHPTRLAYRVQRGRARYELNRDADRFFAREDFVYVLERDPDHFASLINLGQISYVERRLDEAVKFWTRALELMPDDPDIRTRLQRARRELEVEAAYLERRSPQFLVRWGKKIPESDAVAVFNACEEAYSELCQRFQHYPDNAVTVVTIYTPKEFQAATRQHGWVAGLSDGTIRLALGKGRNRLAAARRTIFHEYAHHLIRRIAPKTPGWLHEGLAQLAEGKSVARARVRLRGSRSLHPASLSVRILGQRDPRAVSHFYDLALAFTGFLQEAGGSAGILKLLMALKSGKDEFAALREIYGESRSELFSRWRQQLQAG